MRKFLRLMVPVLVVGGVFLSPWNGTNRRAMARDYGGGTHTSILSFEPKALTMELSKTAVAKVTVTLRSGKTWGTNLRVTAVPNGVAISFDPASGEPPFTSTMTVKAGSTTKPGAHTVKIQATGDDPSAVVPYGVTVQASSGY